MLDEQATRAPDDGLTGARSGARLDPRPEIELKLLAHAGALESLRTAPVITRHARNGGSTRRFEAVYYDTHDCSLFSHGLTLRVRRSGKRHLQTLKRGPIAGQPFVRGEWETAIDDATPNLGLLPAVEIGAPLDGLASRALDPMFTTKVRRRTQILDWRGAVVELAFDEGTIDAGERRESLSELEIELKSGDARILYELGMELLEHAPLRLGMQSKPDRGYQLAFNVAPRATKASAPAITADHTVDDIIGILLGSSQHHLLANQALAEGGRDPEGVHQMRVALRRMRTALALLRRELGSQALEGFGEEAKWIARLLGAARDWDVFIAETLEPPAAALRSEIDFGGLRQAAEPHRFEAYAALREALAGPRYNRFQLSLRHWIESRGWRNEVEGPSLAVLLEPAPTLADRVLTRLHRRAVKRGSHFRHLQPEERHRLRIALKNLRYAGEFFVGLHDGNSNAKNYLGCLAEMQDVLGHDNDASMTQPLLHTLARDPVSPEVQQAIGAVMGWQARDRIEVGRMLRRLWRRFKAVPTFWSS